MKIIYLFISVLYLTSCGGDPAPAYEIGRSHYYLRLLDLKANEDIQHWMLGRKLKAFIPDSLQLLHFACADLNEDEVSDYLLILRDPKESDPQNNADNWVLRPLLLILGEGNNQYHQEVRNDSAITCYWCGGTSGEPFIYLTASRGTFNFTFSKHGGGQHIDESFTFVYMDVKKVWLLSEYHRVTQKLNESNDPHAEAVLPDRDITEDTDDFGIVHLEYFNYFRPVQNK